VFTIAIVPAGQVGRIRDNPTTTTTIKFHPFGDDNDDSFGDDNNDDD
jgi:hypothetical protein